MQTSKTGMNALAESESCTYNNITDEIFIKKSQLDIPNPKSVNEQNHVERTKNCVDHQLGAVLIQINDQFAMSFRLCLITMYMFSGFVGIIDFGTGQLYS